MDIIKKREQVKDNKIAFNTKKDDSIKYYIVYFLNNDDIIYVGKTNNVEEYIFDRQAKYSATHYSYEEVKKEEVDNILAELVLELQPIYNKQVPKNTMFISNNKAKTDFYIDKVEFRKVYKEYGGYEFGKVLYIKKQVFDDIFAKEPVHKDLPRIGKRLNLAMDYIEHPVYSMGGSYMDTLYDEDGNEVQALRDYIPDYKEQYKNLVYLEENEYVVYEHIDSDTFKAKRFTDNSTIELKASNKVRKEFINNKCDNNWIDVIDEWAEEYIKDQYLKLLEKESE